MTQIWPNFKFMILIVGSIFRKNFISQTPIKIGFYESFGTTTFVDFMDPPYFLFLGPVYLVPLFTKTALSRDIAISLNSGDESNQEKLGFLRHPWANSGPQYGILTRRVCILRISNCFIPYSILSLPKYDPNLAKLQVYDSHSRKHFSKKCYFIDPT